MQAGTFGARVFFVASTMTDGFAIDTLDSIFQVKRINNFPTPAKFTDRTFHLAQLAEDNMLSPDLCYFDK